MHPFLENFTIFSIILLENDALVHEILEYYGIIPKKNHFIKCPNCNADMKGIMKKGTKIGFRFVCSNKYKEKCTAMINPTENTLLENAKIPHKDIVTLIILFVLKWKTSESLENINNWRARRNEANMSTETISDWFNYFREVAEIYASHCYKQLGGKGKSITVDETFLTRRKYNRGRITSNHTTTVFGMFCREDKEGLFFITNGKRKRDLWPLISKFCHPNTNIIYTDAAAQYQGVENLFANAVHKTTNHSIGEFVDPSDPLNTINPLENENKILKKSLNNRRSRSVLTASMALHFYRRRKLDPIPTLGGKIEQFLFDIAEVYPGYRNGVRAEGLRMREIDIPTAESEGIAHLMPEPKRPRYDDVHPLDDDEVMFIDDTRDNDWV